MKSFIKKYGLYVLLVVVFLVLSTALKIKDHTDNIADEAYRQDVFKNKEFVNVWLKEDYDAKTREYQIREYNKNNDDNIYVNLKVVDEDYVNMLKTAVANNNQVDIFEYGFYELFRYDRLMSLRELGINVDKVDKGDFLYYEKEPMGVKISGNNVKFVWNKEIIKGAGLDPNKTPQTWEEVIEYARKIKQKYPEVVPFEFPTYYLEDLRISIGEMSVNKGSVYTNFWDYRNGRFDFNYAEDILKIYNRMYKENLLNETIENKTKIHVAEDFADGRVAMIISTYADKNFFDSIKPIQFDIGIYDLPKIDIEDGNQYYYTNDYSAIMVNKNIEINEEIEDVDKIKEQQKHIEAVRKVYEWFLSEEVNKEILASKKALPLTLVDKNIKNDIYPEYNNDNNFTNEIYDPSIHINYDRNLTQKLFLDSIKGDIEISEAIKQLNESYEEYCNIAIQYYNFDFSKYMED